MVLGGVASLILLMLLMIAAGEGFGAQKGIHCRAIATLIGSSITPAEVA